MLLAAREALPASSLVAIAGEMARSFFNYEYHKEKEWQDEIQSLARTTMLLSCWWWSYLIRELEVIPLVLAHQLLILDLDDANEIGALGRIGLDADGQQLAFELSVGRAQRAHERLQLVQPRGGCTHSHAGGGSSRGRHTASDRTMRVECGEWRVTAADQTSQRIGGPVNYSVVRYTRTISGETSSRHAWKGTATPFLHGE